MPSSDPDNGEWVLSGTSDRDKEKSPQDEALLAAVRQAWPHMLAHARRIIDCTQDFDEKNAIAIEIWEKVVRSVAKTLHRKEDGRGPAIVNLENYLIGAFHHRLNRYLERERKRSAVFQQLPSIQELERLLNSNSSRWIIELEESITVGQIVAHMDAQTRNIWKLRHMRYSWKEIAGELRLNEQQVIMRFQRGMEKTKQRILAALRKKPMPPNAG
jgi:DNA-directed RNA polymerase specialized sigma24 family protein